MLQKYNAAMDWICQIIKYFLAILIAATIISSKSSDATYLAKFLAGLMNSNVLPWSISVWWAEPSVTVMESWWGLTLC